MLPSKPTRSNNEEDIELESPILSPNMYSSYINNSHDDSKTSSFISGSVGIAMETIEIDKNSNNSLFDALKYNGKNGDVELNLRIRKRFEESLSYFGNLLNTIANTTTTIQPISPTSPHQFINNNNNNNKSVKSNSSKNTNNSNNNIKTPNSIFISNELVNSKKGRSDENLLVNNSDNSSTNTSYSSISEEECEDQQEIDINYPDILLVGEHNNSNHGEIKNSLSSPSDLNINTPYSDNGRDHLKNSGANEKPSSLLPPTSSLLSSHNKIMIDNPDVDEMIDDNIFYNSTDDGCDGVLNVDGVDSSLYQDISDGKFKTIDQMKSELKESFLNSSFKKREEISFSLQVEQDPLVIDQTIDEYYNSFVNDCYKEIIVKFQNLFPNSIALIKMIRNSSTLGGIEKKSNQLEYEPIHKTHNSSGSGFNSIKETIKYKILDKITWAIVGQFFLSMLPILKWIPKYQLAYIKDDVIASLTVGLMIVPQAMAYSILAGLPAIYGLYSAFIGPIVYGICGQSNEISVGPVAMVSLLIPNIIGLPSTDPEYLVDAFCLSLLSGLILMGIGLLRAGFLVENLLSNPILMGFIQAASFLIICSQIKNLTQIPIPSDATTFPKVIKSFFENYHSLHGWTLLFGLSALTVLIAFRLLNKRLKFKIPIAIIILLVSTLISFLIDSKIHGIKIVDHIPSGLPRLQAVSLTFNRIGKLVVGAFIISILGFVESISIAKKFASIRKYTIEPSQELIALGMVNFIGSFFQAMPATGSFSRTAVNFQSNSRSRVCSIASGVIVACVLLFLTPIIKHTPLCILSAIVIAAAISLFEFEESYHLLKTGELLGFCQLIFVFFITLMLGSEIGIVVAFCVSILQIIYFSARPQLVTLGRLPGTLVFRNVNHYSGAIVNKKIKILRYDARLTYYTVNHFRDELSEIFYNGFKLHSSIIDNNGDDDQDNNGTTNNGENHITNSGKGEKNKINSIRTIIFDMVNVSSIDSTAIDVLNEIMDYYKSQNILILWSDLRPHVQNVMQRTGFLKRLDHQHFFISTHKALEYALSN